MPSLTKQQWNDLAHYVRDEYGSDLDFDEFTDIALGVFEDISGFETMTPSVARRCVETFWRSYRA